jgi:hypothetical protein
MFQKSGRPKNPVLDLKAAEREYREKLRGKPTTVESVEKKTPAKKGMNKLESDYERHLVYLRGEMLTNIIWFAFEGVRLRLASSAWFKPDFIVLTDTGIEFHECKGPFFREAAKVRIKVAAELHPWALFYVVRKIKGVWEYERIQ